MTEPTARAVRLIGLAAVACLLCAGCSLPQLRAAGPARHPARPHAACPASPGRAPAPRLGAILPFSPGRLQAAAVVAGRFAAAYDTWSWRQPPATWLAGLRPMTTSGPCAALTRAAAIPGILAQRDAAHQVAAAITSRTRIRDLAQGSVTVIVTVRQIITSTSGTSQADSRLAVTLVPRRDGWAVWDTEPASTGNS